MIRMIRHRPPAGIRVQLVLWYIVVFILLLLLFGTIFYVNFRNSMMTNFDNDLQLHTQQIAASFPGDDYTLTMQDIETDLPWLIDSDDAPGYSDQGETYTSAHLRTMMRFYNARGVLVYTTSDFLNLRAPASSLSLPLRGISWLGALTMPGGQSIHLNSVPLLEHGRIFGVVEAGGSLTSLNAILRSVIIELLIAMPFALLFGILVSYWLAAHAFAPITRLTRVARSIKDGNLHQRVPVPRAHDEVHQLALTFNEMIEHLDKAFARQRRFVADVSHELRTPVAAIRSMTDAVLMHDPPTHDEEASLVLRKVNAQAERLSDLIDDLFVLAAADEGKIVIERERVRLDRLAVDVAALVEPLAEARGIIVETQAQEPVAVLGDDARLMQVIMNLVDNALAYTDPGGCVTLSVGTKGTSACMSVCDTGSGIEQEHLERIFERFYRTDPARSRKSGGNGLGLAIVDWIVQAHGGRITVESKVGQGSTFTLCMPLTE